MKTGITIGITFLLFSLFSCQQKRPAPLAGFDVVGLAGKHTEWATRLDRENRLVEQGGVLNGQADGTWTLYDAEKGFPKTISSFVEGIRQGPYIEFDTRGQWTKYAEYHMDQLHGKYVEFGTGSRPLKEMNYKNGQLHGEYRESNQRGKLIKSMYYKNGKLHGPFTYYNEAGEKTVEYRYVNGEKVEGGVIPKTEVEESAE